MTEKAIYYNDNFYETVQELSEHLFETDREITNLPEDYRLAVKECDTEPLVIFTPDMIMERCIDEERLPEEAESQLETIRQALKSCIDFEKLNALVPECWYPSRKTTFLTKQDFINTI